jgi:hypothetical protein
METHIHREDIQKWMQQFLDSWAEMFIVSRL